MRGKNDPQTGFYLRLAMIGIVLYWYYQLVQMYVQGSADAPSLTGLIISGILMVGGSLVVGVMAWRLYRQEKAAQEAAKNQEAEEEEHETEAN